MAPRALWKGQLRLSLVSIPVEIFSATKTGARVSFRQIHEPSGERIRYQKVAKGVGPVKSDDIVKGYEVGDEYVLIEPEELEEIRLETKRTLELVQFVDACEIPPLYFDKPYYIVASDDLAADAYRVVRDALRSADKVGLGQLTMRGKEYLCAIKPCGDGLLLETLHYADEIRNADPLFSGMEDAESDEELLDVATTLIEKKTKPFHAEAFEDSYDEALRKLLDAKVRNKKTPRASADKDEDSDGDNVVDLMSALKQSLKEEGGGSSSRRKASGSKSSSSKPSSSGSGRGKSKTASSRKKAS
ncbi:Ku protein [Roseicyclus sp. F158]|uniref:Non-homologous end joining protein Ku n=1 Tax=Tropicimonas omnivorans TaxID=3075590 RepID=A0ABU3DGN9_9RHOB|nr:Ku protein [Roseicyclus sp. F158]MDT0682869.1 Ku protein [Roseicyclus sp. F158]